MKFDQVVLAGGGNRCWWQAGFWHRLNDAFPQAPERIASISAGAATACLLYARPGRAGAEWGLDYYARALADVKKTLVGRIFFLVSQFSHITSYIKMP